MNNKIYILYWKEFELGTIAIDNAKKYYFKRNNENIELASKSGMLKLLIPNDTNGFVRANEITFISDRIERGITADSIEYFTDNFRILLKK